MNTKKPRVSAIVSTYNSEKFIRGKIEDLLNQSIINKLEIIIVNSGSLEGEDTIIQEYLNKYSNIKYIKTEERETIYKAWNRGIKIAEGEFITNANTDDRLKQDAYEILSNELRNNPDIGLVYADQYISKVPNQIFSETIGNDVERMPDFNYLIQLDRCIVYSQPMWRAALHFNDDIWFDETLEVCGDHEFELNISQHYKMLHIPQILGTFYRDSNGSNKSLNNAEVVDSERQKMTRHYIMKYINGLSQSELLKLKRNFGFYVDIPFRLLQINYRFQKFIFPNKHFFSFEFVYYFTAIIYSSLDQDNKAIQICKKFLKYKSSDRIIVLLKKLNKTST